MITPLDIQNKEFKKSFKGYNTKSVDEFLDEIIEDYERVYKENIELKDKVNMLADQIRQYSTLEETLKNTLIVAQTTADEITSSARQKSENIIEDAEIQRQRLLNLAREEVRSIKNEYESFKKEIFVFKTRYKSFIEAQLMSIEEFYNDIGKKEMEEQEDILENQPEEDIEQMGDLGA
ncbi:MAG: DivIVA domain-containing protein [Tissierellaceae bacterium]